MLARSQTNSLFTRMAAVTLLGLAALGLGALLPASSARAQSIVVTVNGDPVTTVDISERQKLLQALGQPASAAAAEDSMIKSRIEAGEINKYGIKVTAAEFAPAMQYYAELAHVPPEALNARLANAHVDKKHMENFFSIHTAFNIYARARNRAVEVSREEIDAELARDKKLAQQQTYVIRQVLLAIPPETGDAGLQQGAKQMETLKGRFTDCETGLKLVADYPNLVVRDPVTRSSSQLGEQLSALLDKTPVGHLTPPSRDSSGIAALALCSREAAKTDATRDAAQQRIMARHVQRDADKLYAELRDHAVIVKPKK